MDGYNLIGTSHRDLKKQRDALIDALIEYRKTSGHDITVVFDGWKTGDAQEQKLVVGGVKIIYSRIGDKADAVIKLFLSSHRREWIVVTSDRAIADHAWSTGSIPVASEDFLKAIERHALFLADEEEEEKEYNDHRRKGNPRQLSRKEKAVRRALQKL